MFNAGFTLGFVVALVVVGAVGRIVGAARLARVFGALAGRPVKIQQAVKIPAPVSPLQADVIAALKNLGVPKADAWGATVAACARVPAPHTFEPLFRGALALARKGVA